MTIQASPRSSARFALTLVAYLLVTALGVGSLRAATFVVDQDGGGNFTTIAPALAAAAAGDTVMVLPGVYTGSQNKNLNFSGLDIVLTSASGAEETVIDGEGSGRAFTFASSESPAAVVQGFTIVDAPDGSPIRITNGSSPTFRGCVIQDNHVTTNSGGGVFCQDSAPTFIDCAIVENFSANHGGGFCITGSDPDSSTTLIGCFVVGNRSNGRGGGLWIRDGAAVSIKNSTIAANQADLSGGDFGGGGLLIAGAATAVTATRSIVWGNDAYLGDDAYVVNGATLEFLCSNVDTTGVTGGNIAYGPLTIALEPHFCRPTYGRRLPWSHGNYTLAANSPCLPANSPCGELIGAGEAGCAPVTVWTGAAGSTDWSNPLNWSTLALPGPGDHVQITRGDVDLPIAVQIGKLTQCFENSSDPGVLTITAGGQLGYGFGLFGAKGPEYGPDQEQQYREDHEVQVVVAVADPNSDGITADSEGDTPHDWLLPLRVVEGGLLELSASDMTGNGVLIVEGLFRISGGDISIVDFEVENVAQPYGQQPGPVGVIVQDGNLVANELITSFAQFDLAADATAMVNGEFLNLPAIAFRDPSVVGARDLPGGLIKVAGSLTGSGILNNLATVAKIDPGVSQVSLAIHNQRSLDPEAVGTVELAQGTWAMGGSFLNDGDLLLGGAAILDLGGPLRNRAAGAVVQVGDVGGTGHIVNTGRWQKDTPSISDIEILFINHFDTATGEAGLLRINGGQLRLSQLDNAGYTRLAGASTLHVAGSLNNSHSGIIGGNGIVAVADAAVDNEGGLHPGFSPGLLRYEGDYAPGAGGALRIEISGPQPGTGYDQLVIDGSLTYGGALHVSLANDYVPSVGDTFAVVIVEGDVPGGGNNLLGPGFDCISGIQNEGVPYLEPMALPQRFLLVATDTQPENAAPTAHSDSYTADWMQPLRLTPLRNDTDDDDDTLSLVSLRSATTRGVAFVDPGDTTITYLPAEGYVGTDTLRYTVTDCNGASDSAMIEIQLAPVVGAPEAPAMPTVVYLHPSFPNPFNPVTRIRFDLPKPGEARLVIYDLRGSKVRTLVSGYQPAGSFVHDWWGLDDFDRRVSSGVYFVRLETEAYVATRKMMLLK